MALGSAGVLLMQYSLMEYDWAYRFVRHVMSKLNYEMVFI